MRLYYCLLMVVALLTFTTTTDLNHSKITHNEMTTPNLTSEKAHQSLYEHRLPYGHRLPWEGRQESYDLEFTTADFFTKIWDTSDMLYVGTMEEAYAKPFCGILNASKSSANDGKWYSDDKGHLWWDPAHCRLRRLSAQEARQCLSGRHIFMTGDSLTRYQYLSLVYFLSKGRYMAPWAHTSQPSLAIEKEWDSWEDFFKTGSLQLSIVAENATAHEDCECTHGAYKNYDDVPSKEHRVFSLKDFSLLNSSQGMEIFVSHKLIYDFPSHIKAGIEGMMHGLLKLPETISDPDLAILNMGFWVRDSTATQTDLRNKFQTIMEHGNHFTTIHNRKSKTTRLFWKTTTSTTGDVIMEESVEAVNDASLQALDTIPKWELYDIRALTKHALQQHLNMYSFDTVHFAPQMYQEFNDYLFNLICSPELEFQSENRPSG